MTVLADLLASVSALRAAEDQLTEAAASDQTDELTRIVQATQPELLHFRGLDRQRKSLEESLGFAGLDFHDIPDHCNDQDRAQLEPLLNRLTTELRLFAKSRENADRIMRVRLMEVQTQLQDIPQPEQFHSTLA